MKVYPRNAWSLMTRDSNLFQHKLSRVKDQVTDVFWRHAYLNHSLNIGMVHKKEMRL